MSGNISATTNATPIVIPRGCSEDVPAIYWNLCDLESLWGVIVAGFAALGVIVSIIFTFALTCCLKRLTRHQHSKYSSLFYFVLLGCFMLFGFSFAFIIKPTFAICLIRRVGIGMSFVITFASLLVGITRAWRMSYVDEMRCCWLGLAVFCISLFEIVILVEWSLLKLPANTTSVCEESENDIPLSMIFNGVLVVLFFISSVIAFFKTEHEITPNQGRTSFCISSLFTSAALCLLTAAWAVMMTYGNNALGRSPQWSDPATAIYMVASGLFVVFIMLPPVFHIARKIRNHEDDAMYTIPSSTSIINARQSFMGSEKYLSPLPTAPPRTSAYGLKRLTESAASERVASSPWLWAV